MISDAAIHDALATLAQLKSMNAPRKPGRPKLVVKPAPYVRTPEEQKRLDDVAADIQRVLDERKGGA